MLRSPRASILIAVGLFAVTARAQQLTETQSFPVERLRVSTNRLGLIDVESAQLQPHLQYDAGLWLGFAKSPLALYRLSDGKRLGSLVDDRVGATLFGSLGLFDWLEVALDVPVVLYQSRPSSLPDALTSGATLHSLSTTNLGDLELLAKVRLLKEGDFPVSLALMPAVTLPTGGATNYFGEKTATFAPELLVSREFQRFKLGANAGAVVRGTSKLADQTIESELTGHLGVGYRFYDDQHPDTPVEADLSLSMATSAAHAFRHANENHAELRAMVAYNFVDRWQAFLGAGLGLARGFGTPDWRIFAGGRLGSSKAPPDRDHDGILDADDRCPDVPGLALNHGCPDVDTDGDGIVDRLDQCPWEPGPEVNHGCPDVDSDGDGIVDRLDKCPKQPEDKDGFHDDDGCPDLDDDGDGVPDTEDACPRVAGPASNHGCPILDRDGDGVPDDVDNCPDEKGDPANHGCKAKQLVTLTADRIEIIENVYFKVNSDVIEAQSFALLDNVAKVMVQHPELKKVLVEGHTDNQGNATYNEGLSDRRAKSVVRYLTGKNVDPARLEAKGYGQTKPIADNKTADGRAKNRRVVFTIVDGGKGIQTQDRGPSGTLEEGHR